MVDVARLREILRPLRRTQNDNARGLEAAETRLQEAGGMTKNGRLE
jgi:hypothetical protein